MTDGSPEAELFLDEGEIKPPTWNDLDATPNDALRLLIELWRDGQTEDKMCADELQEVIDAHE